jgi:hypothetical protein
MRLVVFKARHRFRSTHACDSNVKWIDRTRPDLDLLQLLCSDYGYRFTRYFNQLNVTFCHFTDLYLQKDNP